MMLAALNTLQHDSTALPHAQHITSASCNVGTQSTMKMIMITSMAGVSAPAHGSIQDTAIAAQLQHTYKKHAHNQSQDDTHSLL